MKRSASRLFVIALMGTFAWSPMASANDLEQCGYHDLPLGMEQVPDSHPSYDENIRAMFWTYNEYMDIYMQRESDGSWGRNGDSEFGGWVSDEDLDATWGFSWGDALAKTCYRWWCECCELIESDVVINPAFEWTYDPEIAETNPAKHYYHSVILHELGHTWGMQLPPDIEDYQYEHPTVMHSYVDGIVQDDMMIHVTDAYLLRRTYDNQISVPSLSNMAVTSKYADPYDLTWRNSTSTIIPVYAGERITVRKVTVENTGTEDLTNVHARINIVGETLGYNYEIEDFVWDEFPAETYGVYSFYNLEIPLTAVTDTYKVFIHVTMNGYQEDHRTEDSWTHLVDRVEIMGRTVDVTSPASGNDLAIGSVHTITWDSENIGDDVKIHLSTDGGASWSYVAVAPNTGSYDWTVPGQPANGTCLIKVWSLEYYPTIYDVSEPFSIVGRAIQVIQPNGGELLNVGSTYDILWESNNTGDDVELFYNCSSDVDIPILGHPTYDTGHYLWTVPNTVSDYCRVIVKSTEFPDVEDDSDNTFTIARSGIEVNQPSNDEVWWVGGLGQVEFTYNGDTPFLNVHLRRSLGGSWESLGPVSSDGSPFLWVVAGPVTDYAVFRLTDGYDSESYAFSGTIGIEERSVEVLSPNGGETWVAGAPATITWDSNGAGDTVSLELYADSGATFVDFIDIHAPNTGSYIFTVPETYEASQARVKVRSTSVGGLDDFSDADFTVLNPRIRVLSPNGGEVVIGGDQRSITWASSNAGDFVRVDYRIDGGSWTSINGYTPNDGSHSWTVPNNEPGTVGEVRVTSSEYLHISDWSDAPFTFGRRQIEVTLPAGGEVYEPGEWMTVRWSSENAGRDVTLRESCDRGFTWRLIAEQIENDGSHRFRVSPPRRETCKIRVESWLFDGIADISDGFFEIGNTPPAAVADRADTDEDTEVLIRVLDNDFDVDGDEIEVTAFTDPANGRVELTTHGDFEYEPVADFHGTDSFAYAISDGHGGAGHATVTVVVNPVNDEPVAVDDHAVFVPNTPVTVPVLDNDFDVDGDEMTVIALTSPGHGTATYDAGTVTYTPEAGYAGDDVVEYSIMDGNGGFDSAFVHFGSPEAQPIFVDGFESGDTSAWSGP